MNASTAAKQPEHKGQEKGDDEEEETRVDILEYAHVVVDILVPVTITMLLVVVAVRLLNMSLAGGTVSFAGFVYTESTADSTATKLFGSLLNAAIFLAIIIGVTFLLVLLYKCHCVKLILAWLVLSVLLLFGAIGGFFVYQLVAHLNWPLDCISFAVLIANATVVGAIATFWVAPRWLNQAALIVVSFLVVCAPPAPRTLPPALVSASFCDHSRSPPSLHTGNVLYAAPRVDDVGHSHHHRVLWFVLYHTPFLKKTPLC